MTLIIFAICQSQLLAQGYLTIGTGFSTMLYDSKDLDRFKETYNLVNGLNLGTRMKGFGTGEGLRWQIGYRHFGRLSTAIVAGLQNYKGKDGARFQNGEARNLELKIKSFFVEFGLGKDLKKFFVNGILSVYFNRKLTMESMYQGPTDTKNPLTGTYKSDVPLATDLGIAVGVLREPMVIIAKITYPFYTGGKSNIMEDPNSEKIVDGFNFFPDNFMKFVNGEAYK
ncbi:MAG: hypothetical protein ACE5HI_14140, partial [bacterium]